MTREEASYEQRMLQIKGFNLSFWFGTGCEKCCGVYPRFKKKDTNDKYHDCYYQCDVCGKQTDYYGMPWQCEEAWNNHNYLGEGVQMSIFMEGT